MLTVTAVICTPCAIGLFLWARWLGGTYGAPRWIRWLGFVPAGVCAAMFALSYVTLERVFAVSNGTTAADRQRILANGIAEATYDIALALAMLLLSAVVLLALTWRYRWSQKPPKPAGQPPYR